MVAGASDKLLDLAKNEKDPAVRMEAIRNLAYTRSTTPEALAGLYAADNDPKTKRELINALFSRGDAKAMIDIARKESDPAMKRYIVQQLSKHARQQGSDRLHDGASEMKMLMAVLCGTACLMGQQLPQVENAKLESLAFAGSVQQNWGSVARVLSGQPGLSQSSREGMAICAGRMGATTILTRLARRSGSKDRRLC